MTAHTMSAESTKVNMANEEDENMYLHPDHGHAGFDELTENPGQYWRPMGPGKAFAPPDRAYDPQRRPNIYYKGDPASDEALLSRAIGSYGEGRMTSRPGMKRFDEAYDIVHGNKETDFKPMTMEQAYQRADAGNPISPDATSMAAVDAAPYGDSLDESLRHAASQEWEMGEAKSRAREAQAEAEGAETGFNEAKQDVRKSLKK